jgi:signal transduction histidine kinase
MTLRSRLALGLATIAIILVGPLVYAIYSLERVHADARALRDREFAGSLVLGALREALSDLKRQEIAVVFSKDPQARSAMAQQMALCQTLADSLKYFALDSSSQISQTIEQLRVAETAEYDAEGHGHPDLADSISSQLFTPALNRTDSGVMATEHVLRLRTAGRMAQATATISSAESVSLGALLLAVIVAAIIGVWLARSISAPVRDLETGMRSVADGELGYRLATSPNRSDEFGRLAESFQEMTRQLGELDKLKAEFVSVASHELKTPINVIVGYLQLLEDGIYGPLPPKQLEIHRTIGVQAQTLLRLVKQLLDVSRFEAGGGRLEPRNIQLAAFLEELDDSFHVLALQREIHFAVKREGDLPTEVFWDPDRINEVLGNLLSNAFKFTPRDGEVELKVRPLENGASVEVKVCDTGAGIPPEQLPRIFDKFYQADNQRAAAAAGTGLGLAIAKQIVESHRGTIQCDSSPGAGTTFTIVLPTRVNRRASAQQSAPEVVA